jgi:hypothetical protein
MDRSRRRVLMTGFGGITILCCKVGGQLSAAQGSATLQNPPNPRREGPDDEPLPKGATTKALLEQRQKDIKKDIEKLYELATQLKTEVEKTDATSVLSLLMVRKAEEIEKLAKQIKDHAKGA